MQERVVDDRQAERAVSSWYLSRDGQQHGPLSDRELSLFAEAGNFKPGDLLWTEGLEDWKPADAIFGLASSQNGAADETAAAANDQAVADTAEVEEIEFRTSPAHPADDAGGPQPVLQGTEAVILASGAAADAPDAVDPNGEHVGAIVQALKGEAEPRKLSPKERLFEELKKFSGTCAYLWVVFALLMLHGWVGEARYGGSFGFFVLTTLNAFWLLKVLPLAEHLGPVRDLKQKPLIYSILYKTLAFSVALFGAYALEMMAFSWLGGGGLDPGFTSLAGGLPGALTLWLILSVALLPYFAFKELERAVGADMIGKLLFGAR